MNLHEYQSKELFAKYGIPILRGYPATSPAEAEDAARKLGGDLWVVKAQVHAGGRGKAGGVKLSRSLEEVRQYADDLLGRQLITHQSGPKGLPVNIVYVEEGSNIARELYLSVLIDRKLSQISFIASAAGGMDIEQVAIDTPEQIFTVAIDSDTGVQDFQITELSSGFDLSDRQSEQFANMIDCLYKLFVECDASLIEINPLIVTKSADIIALDAKISIEENALFRQQRLVELRDISQEDAKEHEAAEHNLNYVSLDGNIACMVNGAGLAMAPLCRRRRGEPASPEGHGRAPERTSYPESVRSLACSNK